MCRATSPRGPAKTLKLVVFDRRGKPLWEHRRDGRVDPPTMCRATSPRGPAKILKLAPAIFSPMTAAPHRDYRNRPASVHASQSDACFTSRIDAPMLSSVTQDYGIIPDADRDECSEPSHAPVDGRSLHASAVARCWSRARPPGTAVVL